MEKRGREAGRGRVMNKQSKRFHEVVAKITSKYKEEARLKKELKLVRKRLERVETQLEALHRRRMKVCSHPNVKRELNPYSGSQDVCQVCNGALRHIPDKSAYQDEEERRDAIRDANPYGR